MNKEETLIEALAMAMEQFKRAKESEQYWHSQFVIVEQQFREMQSESTDNS